MRHNRKTERRRHWLAEFETLVTTERPDLSGRIEWNTAIHMFNIDMTAAQAAARWIDLNPPHKGTES